MLALASSRIIEQAMPMMKEEKFKPTPPTSKFDAHNAEDLFRRIQTGQYIGKLVIKIEVPDENSVANHGRPVSLSQGC